MEKGNSGGNLFTLICFILIIFGQSEEIIISVKNGPVRGLATHVGEHVVYSFKNIPFAKPPVGNLRFQIPKEHMKWFSEDDLHGNMKILCPQSSFYEDEVLPDVILGQEDCLVLDVYVRKEHEMENVTLPVLVYFHGGHFSRGSKEDCGPDYLLRHSDVILVVPNYRLGILGFLSFHDKILPGNMGLWDQNAALRWVSQNIEFFGGDPQKVTIAGHEAGATSVGLHILASASHNYFQAAVSGSGTALSPSLVDIDQSPTKAYRVAEVLRCPDASKDEILKCLKSAPLHEILKTQGMIKKAIFLPTIDSVTENSLIPFPPRVLYGKRYQKDVNYLIGFTENEASYEVAREFPKVLKFHHLDKMIHHFLRPHFKDILNFEMIAKAAKYHYMKGLVIPTFESLEPEIAKIMSDFLYSSPAEETIKLHEYGTRKDIFLYIHKSKTENYCRLENRRCYGNEFYLFNTSYHPNMFNQYPRIEKMTETISKIWGNFIKFGSPDEKWKPFKEAHGFNYAEISDTIHYKSGYRNDASEFWVSLVSELIKAENATDEASDAQISAEYSTFDSWGATGLAILCGVLCVALIGLVLITKRRTLTMSIVPVSSPKDITQFTNS